MLQHPNVHEPESRRVALKEYLRAYHARRRSTATPEQLEDMRRKGRESAKRWAEKHPEQLSEVRQRTVAKHKAQRLQDTREWRANNKVAVSEYNKQWHASNREYAKQVNAEWYARNMASVKVRRVERYHSDPQFKIKTNLRSRIYTVLKRRLLLGYKSQSMMKLVGCSVEELMVHIEGQFLPGMSWSNHGDWHIDHIRPCASFDLTDQNQQHECFHYTNLQPLWKADNIRKANRWVA